MERPKDAAGWAEFYKQRDARLQAARNRAERERSKAEPLEVRDPPTDPAT
jgi:hypothetical protein